MSFSSLTVVNGPYAPNGATVSFPFTFRCITRAEIEVYRLDSGGAETMLAGYDVVGVGAAGGGTVVFTSAPASGDPIYVRAKPFRYQPMVFRDQTSYAAADLEDGLDRLTQSNLLQRLYGGGGTGGGGGGGVSSWNDLQNRPSILDLIATLTPAPGKVIEFTGPSAVRLITTPTSGGGGGGGGVDEVSPPSLAFFGDLDPTGASSTLNNAAFIAAEASAYERVWIPEGIYLTTRTVAQLTKSYEGPGQIITGGNGYPGKFRYLAAAPAVWPTQGDAGWFRGDQHFAEPSYSIVGPGTRESTTARYFESSFIPNHSWFAAKSGQSGQVARLAAVASTGSANVTLNGASPTLMGKTITFTSLFGGTLLDTRTVTNVAGNVLTLNAPPSANHPIGTVVSTGPRTWNGHSYRRIAGECEGDVYGDIIRMRQRYVPKDGQHHFFTTSTVGGYGVDVLFEAGSSGTYCTGTECIYDGGTEDVAVIADVESFIRNNDTGARAVVWGGSYYQSTGSKPADFAFAVAGKWRVALDTVRADMTNFGAPGDNANAAINTAKGHKWYMNSTNSNAARGGDVDFGNFYGNVLGDMIISSEADGTSDFIELKFNRASPNNGRIRIRPNVVTTNVNFQGGGTVEAAKELVTNGNTTSGKPTVVFGAGSGNYIDFDTGTDRFRFFKSGIFSGYM